MAQSVASKIDELLRRGSRDEQMTALSALARDLLHANDTDGALLVMDRAVRLDGRSAPAWSLRGEVLAKRNRAGEALGSFDRAIGLDATFVTALVMKADLLLKIGSSAEALECYEIAVKAAPELAHLWTNRARALASADRTADAIASVDHALALSDAAGTWALRGEIQLKANELAEAKESFAKAVAIDPLFETGWYELAMAASKTKDNDTAKRAALQFLEIAKEGDPRIAALRSLLFQIDRHQPPPRRPAQRISSSRMRRVSRAMKAVGEPESKPSSKREDEEPPPESNRTVADVDGGFEDSLGDLLAADALHRAGRHVEALRKIEVLTKSAPGEANVWILRARLLIALGKPEAAVKSADDALALGDESAAVWKVVAHAAALLRRPERALEAIAKAEAIAPRDAEVHRIRGECLASAGRHAEAVYALDKATLYAPQDAETWLALGRLLHQLRRSAGAKDAFEKARDLADSASRPDLVSEARRLLDQLG